MKKLNAIILFLVSAFFIFSCKMNLSEIDLGDKAGSEVSNIPEGKSLVTVNFSLFNSSAKIAGIPDFSSIDIEKYVLTAKASGQTTQTLDVTKGATTANVLLVNDIEWTIIIEGKNASGKTVIKGENSFTPTAVDKSTTVTISPYQQTSKNGTAVPGSVKLNIEFPQEDCTLKIDWYIDGALQPTVNADVRAANVTKVFEASSVEPGTHRITLNIFNSNQPSEVIIKVYDLVVYSNMETKLWHNNAAPQEKITLTTDDITPVTLEDYAFYVLGTGATSLNGTPAAVAQLVGKKRALKFDTIQEAVNAIEGADPEGKYRSTIYLDGSVMEAAPDGASEVVKIGNGTNKPHIFIKGYNNSAAIFNLTASPAYARIMTIESNAVVDIEGVSLMGGVISSADGGGIYSKGKLNFSGNITSCVAKNGGGIYCDGGEIDFKGSIKNCSVTNKGGAIFVARGTIEVSNFEIQANEAGTSGGGAYLEPDNSVKVIFENGKFLSNTASRGTGGAITCGAQSGTNNGEYIYNASCKNVQFIENKAKGVLNDYGQGGAIYVYSGRFLALIDCSTEGNTAEQIGYGTEKYNGIFNNGTIYLGNTADIQDGLCVNNAVKLASTVTPADGKTVIATIYPSVYTEGREVLKAYSGSLTSDMISYFPLSNSNWQIDSAGKLKSLAVSGPGSISVNDDILTFKLSTNKITQSENVEISVSLDITASGGTPVNIGSASLSSVIDELSIKVYSGSQEITSALVPGFDITGGKILIPSDMINEFYRVEILGKYNSVGVSASCNFEILR